MVWTVYCSNHLKQCILQIWYPIFRITYPNNSYNVIILYFFNFFANLFKHFTLFKQIIFQVWPYIHNQRSKKIPLSCIKFYFLCIFIVLINDRRMKIKGILIVLKITCGPKWKAGSILHSLLAPNLKETGVYHLSIGLLVRILDSKHWPRLHENSEISNPAVYASPPAQRKLTKASKMSSYDYLVRFLRYSTYFPSSNLPCRAALAGNSWLRYLSKYLIKGEQRPNFKANRMWISPKAIANDEAERATFAAINRMKLMQNICQRTYIWTVQFFEWDVRNIVL